MVEKKFDFDVAHSTAYFLPLPHASQNQSPRHFGLKVPGKIPDCKVLYPHRWGEELLCAQRVFESEKPTKDSLFSTADVA